MNDLHEQDRADEAAANSFAERCAMAEEITIPGATARSIARYIRALEVESDNDLAGIQTLTKELMDLNEQLVAQNAELKRKLINLTAERDRAVADLESYMKSFAPRTPRRVS